MRIFRPETFGGVLFNTADLRFELVNERPSEVDRTIPERFHSRDDILSAPVRAYFEVTRQCNLACRQCFVSSSPTAFAGKSTEDVALMIDELSNNGVIDVRFTGGEITQRPDWVEILDYAKSKGLVFSVNTNGVFEDLDDIVEKLSVLDPNQVTVSIDGSRENHDYMRGKGSYESTVKSLKAMRVAGINLRLNTVLTRRNVGDVEHVVALADQFASECNFFHMRPVGRGKKRAADSLTFDQHYTSAVNTLALRKKYPGLSIMHFEQSYRERSVKKDETPSIGDSLSHGQTTINIDAFGNVWPNGYNTYQDDRFNLGNLLVEGLEAIWHSSERLDEIRTWYRAVLTACKGCDEYLNRCPGLSPEMEISRMVDEIENNFCIYQERIPQLFS